MQKLEIIILNKLSQTHAGKCHVGSHLWVIDFTQKQNLVCIYKVEGKAKLSMGNEVDI